MIVIRVLLFAGFHTDCLDIYKIPDGNEWFCPDCVKNAVEQ